MGWNSIYAILFVFIPTLNFAQRADTSALNKKRLTTFIAGSAVAYGVTLVGLNELWYSNNPRQSFHFFNDNAEWKQVDKAGHLFSAFYLSAGASSALTWSGVRSPKAELVGSLIGFGVMLPIEIFDGYSSAYGASGGDLLANAAGSALFYGQKALWNEVRIYPKFSFHYSDYAALRPNVLGDNAFSKIVKDYNGQTYWLSFDMDKFMQFPKWLNLAAGYGANGMVYARDSQNTSAGYPHPYRQYYLSIDIDLRAIRTRSKFINDLISVISIVKLPAPALEFSKNGLKFEPFYF